MTRAGLWAQFDDMINAVLTSEGERVIVGANLVEVLDCASPIAIVSVPDHRFGDFYVGQRGTIRPFDSEEEIIGAVQHISSDALISRDTSIAASPGLKVGGNKVTVALHNGGRDPASARSCDTARRAVVTIETDTLVSQVGGLVTRLFRDSLSDSMLGRAVGWREPPRLILTNRHSRKSARLEEEVWRKWRPACNVSSWSVPVVPARPPMRGNCRGC